MAVGSRMTVAFSGETRELMDQLVPTGERTSFVDRAVRAALERLAREKLEEEMAECAEEMYSEIMSIQRDMTPLEEEVHRAL